VLNIKSFVKKNMIEIDEIRKERNLLRHEVNKLKRDYLRWNGFNKFIKNVGPCMPSLPTEENPEKHGDFYVWYSSVEPDSFTKELNIDCVTIEDMKTKFIDAVKQRPNESGDYEFIVKESRDDK
jgi:hypothetical protein